MPNYNNFIQYALYCDQKYGHIVEKYCTLFFERLKSISPLNNLKLILDRFIYEDDNVHQCGLYVQGGIIVKVYHIEIMCDGIINKEINSQNITQENDLNILTDFIFKHACFYIIFHEICHSTQLIKIFDNDNRYDQYLEENNARTMLKMINENPIVKSVMNDFDLTDYLIKDSIESYFTEDFKYDYQNYESNLSLKYFLGTICAPLLSKGYNNDNLYKLVDILTNKIKKPIEIFMKFDFINNESKTHSCHINGTNDIQEMNITLDFYYTYINISTALENTELTIHEDDNMFYIYLNYHNVKYVPLIMQ